MDTLVWLAPEQAFAGSQMAIDSFEPVVHLASLLPQTISWDAEAVDHVLSRTLVVASVVLSTLPLGVLARRRRRRQEEQRRAARIDLARATDF